MKWLKAFLLPAFLTVQMWAQDSSNWLNEGTPRTVYVKHKAVHAVGGLVLTWAFAEMGYPKTGLFLTLLAAVLKERYDQLHGGSFRGGDIAWTIMPAATIVIAFRW